ncbi:MFS-type transporter SLC18B1-like [Physella acuta]|uniref:MFS-type transporter SLC18B1-like n=1 Tax=Physella acuta TaxID=109671 RepID=UPI0027DD267B|nr:MFS-type transporter SLC18B1-like [Physella acuta]
MEDVESQDEETHLLIQPKDLPNGHKKNGTISHRQVSVTDGPVNLTYTSFVDFTTSSNKSLEQKFRLFRLSYKKKMVVGLLILSMFSSGCGFSLMAPFFPQEAEKKGVSNTVTGFIFSSFEFMIFISSPFFGNYLTRIGPKFMLVSGLLVAGSCSILFGTLDRCPPGLPFIVVCFACRCVEALAASAFMTSGFAIISNEFPQNVATVFALLEMADGIGLMTGPALGGFLYQVGGYGLPFFVVGTLIILTGIGIFMFLPKPQELEKERKTSFLSLLKSPMVWFTGQSIMMCSLGILFLDPTLAKHLEQFNLSTGIIGLIFFITPCLYAITSPIWGYISDSKNINGSLITLGNLMCGIGLIIVGPSPYLPFLPSELWVIIIGLVILGMFYALAIVPALNCLLIGAVEVGFENNIDTYGVVVGLFNSIFCLGSFIGPMLGGVLIEEMGFRYGATLISGIYFFVMVCCGGFFLCRHFKARSCGTFIYEMLNTDDECVNSDYLTMSQV